MGVPVGEPKLVRLEESDDTEHFLTTFERLAAVYKAWAVGLIPLLTGKARSAFVAMDPTHTTDYDQLKFAILKKYEIGRGTYCQRFQALYTPTDESPEELYTHLKDLFCKWVDFTTATKEQVMEKIVLEQYFRVLYPEVKTWVKERHLETAAEAAELVDANIAAHRGQGSYRYAGQLRQARGWSEGVPKGGGLASNSSSHPRPSKPVVQEFNRRKVQSGDAARCCMIQLWRSRPYLLSVHS